MSSSRKCRGNSPTVFYYTCGEYTLSEKRRNSASFVERARMTYYVVKLVDQDKYWSAHSVGK